MAPLTTDNVTSYRSMVRDETLWSDSEAHLSDRGLESKRSYMADALLSAYVRKSEILNVTTQLAVMMGTGISLSQSLEAIIDQCPNVTLVHALRDIRESIQSGADLSSSLSRYPRFFDRTYIAMVEAAEQTGRLPETLEQVAHYMEKKQIYSSRIQGALAYPTVILFLTAGVTIFLLTHILPRFKPLFEREGHSLPLVTDTLIQVSNHLQAYWFWWQAALVAAIAGFLYWRSTDWGQRQWDWMMIRTPVVGPLVQRVALSRSILTLGVMLNCGVSVLEAITLTSKVAGNTFYREVWNSVRERVAAGDRIVTALRGQTLFPPTLVQMMNAGEESGRLNEVLEKISRQYDREVDSQIKTLSTVIEPLLIVIMGSIVGTIGMAIMLPIFSLSQQV